MTSASDDVIYYDPFDIEIEKDPYPIWRRLRDEAPLYYNEKYGFYALSRFDDVEPALVDWETYRSGKGSVLEFILANIEIPPGMILFEDPPVHDVHRGLLSRVFTPKKMNAIEPQVRQFCARTLDPLVGTGGFDFVRDLGAEMPMRTIGMLLGIPSRTKRPSATESMRTCGLKGRLQGTDGRRAREWRRVVLRVHRLAGEQPIRRPDDRAPDRRVRGRDRHQAQPDPRRGPGIRPAAGGRRKRHDHAV